MRPAAGDAHIDKAVDQLGRPREIHDAIVAGAARELMGSFPGGTFDQHTFDRVHHALGDGPGLRLYLRLQPLQPVQFFFMGYPIVQLGGGRARPRAVDEAVGVVELELAPLAYMRGRTLNHAFIILDEAQNTTPEQMKMFLTRIGFGAKAVVNGDITQIDLARGQKSGLIEARRILAAVRGIAFTEFTAVDVVRHPLVARIIDAYDAQAPEE